MIDVAIIGGGVCGCSLLYALSRYRLRCALLEKSNDVGVATTKANSAIVHAGYDPAPGTLMAKYNVPGNALVRQLAARLDIMYKPVGSLVVGFNDADAAQIEELYAQGLKNGVPGMELLNAEALHALEPGVNATAQYALHAPTAAVVNPWELAFAQAEVAVQNGAEVLLETEVTAIEKHPEGGFVLHTRYTGTPGAPAAPQNGRQSNASNPNRDEIDWKNPENPVENSAENTGKSSPRAAQTAQAAKTAQTARTAHTTQAAKAAPIAQTPQTAPTAPIPTVAPAQSTPLRARFVINCAGVHSAQVAGMAGAAGFSISPSRGQYYLLDKSEGETVGRVVFQCPTPEGKGVLVAPTVHGNLIVGPNAEAASNNATTAAGLAEVRQMARRSVPGVNFKASIRNFAGQRAVADTGDFIVGPHPKAPGFFNVAGIKSPGLTAAPAIALAVVEQLAAAGLELREKEDFIEERRILRFNHLNDEERAAAIAQNPLYGRIVCRCETVSEGEILDALRRPLPPRSLDAVKRRCGPGMGRCQGGFCGPRVQAIIAAELGIPQQQVPQDRAGMTIVTGRTKQGVCAAAGKGGMAK